MNFKEYYLEEALEDYFPTAFKAGRELKRYAPEYQNQFAQRTPAAKGKGGIFSGKTLAEIQQQVLEWRTKHITNKDRTPAAARAEEELKSISAPPTGSGAAPHIKFATDGTFTDAGYILPGASDPKPFTNIGHYANQVLDSMITYANKGYPMKDTLRFLRFDKGALEMLKKHGYLYTGS